MESEQLFNRGYGRSSYNSIASASSDEELLDGVLMDFHTAEDDSLLDGDASPGRASSAPTEAPAHTSAVGALARNLLCCTAASYPGIPVVLLAACCVTLSPFHTRLPCPVFPYSTCTSCLAGPSLRPASPSSFKEHEI
ncbi:hypothetical protein Z043_124200 [Scleropages formosus]|uniref:Uncharacterized protein n=1 Tax=Scleropages formosus TaxID=113540 RepID=A0A0P7TKA3_SCLFO|nr:hypothetical protein Z043_124200 [Scleropages formosus]